jgi:hypothetical protein
MTSKDKRVFRSLDRKQVSGELAPRTVANIKERLRAVARVCNATTFSHAILKKRFDTWRRIRESWDRVETVAATVSAIVSAFKHTRAYAPKDAVEYWRARAAEVNGLAKANADNNVMTDKVAATMVALEDVRTAVAKLGRDESTLDASQTRLWLTLVTEIPAKRDNYGALRVLRAGDEMEPGENAVVLDRAGALLVLQRYKTAGQYGVHTERLSDTASRAIKTSLQNWPRKYLFLNKKGGPFLNSTFRTWAQRKFFEKLGKKVTLNGLRKSWVRDRAGPQTTTADQEKLAKLMGHSWATQRKRYTFVSKNPKNPKSAD